MPIKIEPYTVPKLGRENNKPKLYINSGLPSILPPTFPSDESPQWAQSPMGGSPQVAYTPQPPVYTPPTVTYNPDGSMKLNNTWEGIDNSQQVPFSTPPINQIQTTPNQGNTDFTTDPSNVNNYVDAPKVQKRTISTNYNPYEQLVNVFDFGLNTLNNLKNQKTQKENFQPQQPSTSYFNLRSLRGDKVMFAKKGGEYKEGGEYELDDIQIQNLKKLGYEFEILS